MAKHSSTGQQSTFVDDRAIELLALASEDGEDIWEAAVSLGVQLSGDKDSIRWKQAKICSLIDIQYGNASLNKFANDIHESVKTVRENKQVYNYFGQASLDQWRVFPILMYTHFRLAMRLGENQESRIAAETFLRDAVDGDWSVSKAEIEQARRLGKPIHPRKIGELEAAILDVETEAEAVTLQIHDPQLLDEFRQMHKDNRPLTLKLFVVDPEPTPEAAAADAYEEAEPEGLSGLRI